MVGGKLAKARFYPPYDSDTRSFRRKKLLTQRDLRLARRRLQR